MDNIRFSAHDGIFNWLRTTQYNGPVGISAKFYVKSDQIPKFREAMKARIDFSKSAIGIRHYKLHVDFNNPSIFWVIEEWDSVTDIKNHRLSEMYIKNSELFLDLLEGPECQIGLYKSLEL